MCERLCILRFSRREKLLLQVGQRWGFSLVWVRMWMSILYLQPHKNMFIISTSSGILPLTVHSPSCRIFLTWHWTPCLCERSPPSGSSTQNPSQAWHGSRWHGPPGLVGSQRAGGTRGRENIQHFKLLVMTEIFESNPSLLCLYLPSSSGRPVAHPLTGQERPACHSSGQWTWRTAGEVPPRLRLARKTERPVRCENSDKRKQKGENGDHRSAPLGSVINSNITKIQYIDIMLVHCVSTVSRYNDTPHIKMDDRTVSVNESRSVPTDR